MAYAITHFWPGGTDEQYRATIAAVHPADGLPEGQTYHAAGPTDGGYLVIAVWTEKADFERFVSEKLMGTTVEGGLVGPPEERTTQVANLETA